MAALATIALPTACGTATSASDATAAERGRAEAAETLTRSGLTIAVPDGWHGEAFTNRAGMSVFRVGSFSFPARTDDDVGQVARAAMRAEDVLINIVDVTAVVSGDDAVYRVIKPPLVVDGSQVVGQEGYNVPAVIDSVSLDGHKLYVSVAFGQAPPSPAQIAAANAVLRTLDADDDSTTATTHARACPTDWQGPWAACREAEWVRRVVEAAGGRVVGETGSAWIATRGGDSFYIWTTVLRRSPRDEADGTWRKLGTSAGSDVYGDDDLWRLWVSQGSIFWVKAGPAPTSTVPDVTELEPLVAASKRLAPPPR